MNRPTLAAVNAGAWAANVALTLLFPSRPRHVIEAENEQLRNRVAELEAECDAIAAVADDMARKAAMLRHPSALTADLAACETFEDFQYLTGGDAK